MSGTSEDGSDQIGQASRPLHGSEQGKGQRLQVEQERRLVHRLREQQRITPDGDQARPTGEERFISVKVVAEECGETERCAARTMNSSGIRLDVGIEGRLT